jgi:hypothetical protein
MLSVLKYERGGITMTCQCGEAHSPCPTEYQYAVKLVCGVVSIGPTGAAPLAPGRYYTAINIHNPQKCDDAHFRWKVVVANPLNMQPAVPDYQRPRMLAPDYAVEIDCQQIMQTFPAPPPPFVKGWVVIESDCELDVVAVYTAAQGASALVNAFHTERVPARCVPACQEDLVLPLTTGIAGWQTVAPTPGFLGPVALVTTIPSGVNGWMNPPPLGASWVSQLATDGAGGAPVTHYYELCFDLCSGFTPPAQLQIQVLADGSPALVYLNGPPALTPSVSGWTTPTTIPVPSNRFRAGRNCFRIEVPNGPAQTNPTGFAVAGLLRVPRGKCPCRPLPMAS